MGLLDNKTNVYIDLDGVIANFLQSAIEAHFEVSPIGGMVPSEVYTWDFFEEYGLTREEFFRPINEWTGFWEYIEPYATAEDFLFEVQQLVRSSGLDVKVHFCSSPTQTADCYYGKMKWLEKHGFMKYADSLMLVSDKSTLIRPDAILIDDFQGNVDTWRLSGGLAVLYPRQWNDGGVCFVEGHGPSELEAVDTALDYLGAALKYRSSELKADAELRKMMEELEDEEEGDDEDDE